VYAVVVGTLRNSVQVAVTVPLGRVRIPASSRGVELKIDIVYRYSLVVMAASEPRTEDETRDRLIDAAAACISRYGVQKTTIDDVAKKAGVARATLYKYVPGGRDELMLAVLMRESERNIDVVLAAMQDAETLEDSLTAGVLAVVDRIRADDHLEYLFSPEILGYASRLEGAGEVIVVSTTRILRPYLDAGRAQGLIPPDLGDRDIADWMLRIIASLLWFDGLTRDREELSTFVRRFAIRPLLTAPADALRGGS
jgi:AcrR family transcriptional regulator